MLDPPRDMRVVVAGAGALGLSIAVELARAGAVVTVADSAARGDNASGVAAGMLAPAFESVFDEWPGHFDLLMRARDLWPSFAASLGLPIERPGTLAISRDEARIEEWRGALDDLGVTAAVRSRREMARLRPDLAHGLFGLSVEDDWRLDSRRALAALTAEGVRLGVTYVSEAVAGFTAGRAELVDGTVIEADCLVIATGASRTLQTLAPEVGRLTPIKGQILEFACSPGPPEIVRFDGGYVCPTGAGLLLGATMETGRSDTEIDAERTAALRESAALYWPELCDAPSTARVGIRAATGDGLPIVGPSASPNVWLAVGARRNGWLLAPFVARSLVGQMRGGRLRAGALHGKAEG